jgi:hypothetical protein
MEINNKEGAMEFGKDGNGDNGLNKDPNRKVDDGLNRDLNGVDGKTPENTVDVDAADTENDV